MGDSAAVTCEIDQPWTVPTLGKLGQPRGFDDIFYPDKVLHDRYSMQLMLLLYSTCADSRKNQTRLERQKSDSSHLSQH